MIVRTSLLAASIAIVGVSSFAPVPNPAFHSTSSLRASSLGKTDADTSVPSVLSDTEAAPEPLAIVADSEPVVEKKVKKPPVQRKKKANPAHKEGVFSPVVVAAKQVLGEQTVNKVRGKFISTHSDVIKKFVATADSPFGQRALSQLFKVADEDGDGKLTKEEIAIAFRSLGFSWLKEKQIEKIIERADMDQNGLIDYEEFAMEAPKTLKTNLVKLAKKNGGDMGWLV